MNQLVAVLLVTQLLSTSYLLALLYKTRQEIRDLLQDVENAQICQAVSYARTPLTLNKPIPDSSQQSKEGDCSTQEKTEPQEI